MKIKEIAKRIKTGDDKYFGYSHFDASNMADYSLMSSTIEDMMSVYDIDEDEAAALIMMLTHNEEDTT